MKKVYNLIVLFFVVIGLSSCSAKEDENQLLPPTIPISNGLKPAEGDEPIHHNDLEKFLPKSIEGYDMEDPEGTVLNMQGFSVMSATAEYTRADEDYIRVSILDYNAAPSVYKTETANWGNGMTTDSDDLYAKSFSLNNELKGWESFEKIYKKARVDVGIGNRLIISVEANNQLDAEKSKDIISLMNLKNLDMHIKEKKNE